MSIEWHWARVLVIAGIAAMVIGAVDPLEGSLVILPGIATAALGTLLAKSRQRKVLGWALVLCVLGVGALWGLSALGGIGGTSGRSYWWGLVLLPYPAAWILALVGAIRALREG